jgi:tetratricopeptide (TPR) repeat protein
MRRYRSEICVSIALALLTLAAFWPLCTRAYGFVNFDDDDYVANNPHVQAGLTRAGFTWAFTTYTALNWHPLTWLSLQLDAQLHGLDPRGFHLTNLLLHAASTVVLFLALRGMTGAVWRSALVAALFAIHPLHVESVAWVSERKDVLSGLFWMLTLAVYAAYVRRPRWPAYAALIVVYALGLLAKPMLVTLPCVLLLLDYWPLRRWRAESREGRAESRKSARLLVEKLPLFALAAGCCVLTVAAQHDVIKTTEEISLRARVLNVPVAYLMYLRKAFWPTDLAVLYPHAGSSLSVGMAAAAAAVLLLFTGLILWAARRRPYLVVGWLWFLGTLVPVIGLVQVGLQAMADRYTYIPLIGILLMLAWGVPDLLGQSDRARVAISAAGALVLGLCLVCTWTQIRHWQNSRALWEHTVNVTSQNPVARYSLGRTLWQEGKTREAQGKTAEAQTLIAEARKQLEEAVRLAPSYVLARCALADLLFNQGETQQAKGHCRAALEANPRSLPAYTTLGLALLREGNAAEARAAFEAALELEPASPVAHDGLGQALFRQGARSEAMRHFTAALAEKPDWAVAHYDLALVLLAEGRAADAEPHLAAVLREQPDLSAAHDRMGRALWQLGRHAEALASFRRALALQPDNGIYHGDLGSLLWECGQAAAADAEFRAAGANDSDWQRRGNRTAWAYASHPDVRHRNAGEALRLARLVSHAAHDEDAGFLDTLAAAYAEAGLFADAVRTAEKAIRLASAGGQADRAKQIRARLHRYEQRQPYRDADAFPP